MTHEIIRYNDAKMQTNFHISYRDTMNQCRLPTNSFGVQLNMIHMVSESVTTTAPSKHKKENKKNNRQINFGLLWSTN